MNELSKKIISYLIIFLFVFNVSGFYIARANDRVFNDSLNGNSENSYVLASVNIPLNGDEEIETNEIKDLKNLIDNKQQEIKSFTAEIDKYKELIKTKQEQAQTLESQISILENQIAKMGLDIKKLEAEIDEVRFKIQEKEREIMDTEEKIELQKERIAENIRILNRNDDRSYLELFLMNDKFSDFFDSLQSLKNLERELQTTYNELLELKGDLDIKKNELENEKDDLDAKKSELAAQNEKLTNQQYSKEVVLAQTIETEKEFRNLMYQLQQEQNQTSYQIQKLEAEVRKKLEVEREKRAKQGQKIDDPARLSWPIPNQGVTVVFHDPDYPFRKWIGEHSGIDIRTLKNGAPTNGLPVKAAADGIVLKIIREGKLAGNVVYILHDNDIMTVYMHLSRIDVKEDQFLSRGEVIGLSGGMPGTPGAGRISTGPHLHFEVRLKGIPVNPFNYLGQ
ncbi:MAG: peptidoglycan DD-metalloendopeptidase family protein [bacterium]